MSPDWSIIFSGLGILGSLGGLATFFTFRSQVSKTKAEAKKLGVEASAAEDAAENEQLKTIVTYVVEPLKKEIDGLRLEVADLRGRIDAVSRRYRTLVDWARTVLAWSKFHPDLDPPLPPLPPEISEDL